MKKFKIVLLVAFALSTVLFSGCDDDDDDDNNPTPAVPAMLTIEMDHLAGSQKFYYDSTYTTANGDMFSADLFKYYVSNIRLIRADNSVYTIPQTYFLVNHGEAGSLLLNMDTLVNGSYKAIRFILGVDSARNVSGAQTGALSPDKGMLWDWNTGYIFLKLEGSSPVITPSQSFTYHIGGFSGANVNYKEVNLDFDGDVLTLANNGHPELHLTVDVLEIFKNPNTINMATFPNTVMSTGSSATTLAQNYADMFKYDHIHND